MPGKGLSKILEMLLAATTSFIKPSLKTAVVNDLKALAKEHPKSPYLQQALEAAAGFIEKYGDNSPANIYLLYKLTPGWGWVNTGPVYDAAVLITKVYFALLEQDGKPVPTNDKEKIIGMAKSLVGASITAALDAAAQKADKDQPPNPDSATSSGTFDSGSERNAATSKANSRVTATVAAFGKRFKSKSKTLKRVQEASGGEALLDVYTLLSEHGLLPKENSSEHLDELKNHLLFIFLQLNAILNFSDILQRHIGDAEDEKKFGLIGPGLVAFKDRFGDVLAAARAAAFKPMLERALNTNNHEEAEHILVAFAAICQAAVRNSAPIAENNFIHCVTEYALKDKLKDKSEDFNKYLAILNIIANLKDIDAKKYLVTAIYWSIFKWGYYAKPPLQCQQISDGIAQEFCNNQSIKEHLVLMFTKKMIKEPTVAGPLFCQLEAVDNKFFLELFNDAWHQLTTEQLQELSKGMEAHRKFLNGEEAHHEAFALSSPEKAPLLAQTIAAIEQKIKDAAGKIHTATRTGGTDKYPLAPGNPNQLPNPGHGPAKNN